MFTKGAPDILLASCAHEQVGDTPGPLTRDRVVEISATNEELARAALRTLGVALRELPKELLERKTWMKA